MSFLNADGTINAGQMVSEALAGGGQKLPDGVYTCRLLSQEVRDALGEGKTPLPGKKKLDAKFVILTGEHEKEELYVSYKLFNGESGKVGSTSGTVRLLTDLAAIGHPVVESGVKLVFDKDGNMAVVHASGPSTEALKAHWAKAFAGKIVEISSKTETSTDKKNGKTFTYSVRQVIGLADKSGTKEKAETAVSELPPAPEDEETAY